LVRNGVAFSVQFMRVALLRSTDRVTVSVRMTSMAMAMIVEEEQSNDVR
jgi:hypothetical protein